MKILAAFMTVSMASVSLVKPEFFYTWNEMAEHIAEAGGEESDHVHLMRIRNILIEDLDDRIG